MPLLRNRLEMLWFGLGLTALVLLAVVWWYHQHSPLALHELGFPTHIVKIGDWDFHYVDQGRGETVILLHGIGANILCWRRLWPLLTPHFRVIALDLPGFGRSSKHDSHYGLDEQRERLEQFLDQVGIRTAHLIGNSMGANIALWFAAHNPSRTSSVTVIAPATSPKLLPGPVHLLSGLSGPLSYILSRPAISWAHRRTVAKKELVDHLRITETWQTYGRRGHAVRSFFRATQTIRDGRLVLALPKIEDPVLILWGEGDRLVPWSVVDQLQRSLKKSTVKIHKSGGHHLQEDEPDWVAQEFFSTFGPKKI